MANTRRRRRRAGDSEATAAEPPQPTRRDPRLETIEELCSHDPPPGGHRRRAPCRQLHGCPPARRRPPRRDRAHLRPPPGAAGLGAPRLPRLRRQRDVGRAAHRRLRAPPVRDDVLLLRPQHEPPLPPPPLLPPRLPERRLARREPGRVTQADHRRSSRRGAGRGRSSAAASPRSRRRASGFLPFPHTRLLFWSAAILLPMLGARMAGVDSDGLAILQIVPTLILLMSSFLLVDWRLSEVVPGANDNASGVAVALSLARPAREGAGPEPRHLGRPDGGRGVRDGGHALVHPHAQGRARPLQDDRPRHRLRRQGRRALGRLRGPHDLVRHGRQDVSALRGDRRG